MRRRALCICVAIAATTFAACAPNPSLVGCAHADPATITEAQARVTEGTLKYGGTATGKDGRVFVSASLDRPGTEQDDDILTWLVVDGALQSVDEQARKHSTWPGADIDVRADGARSSRACVANYRTSTTTSKE